MSESPIARAFEPTLRQKRLKTLTLIILVAILVMIGIAVFHPFFHPLPPPTLTPRIRRALAVQGILILCYISIIFLLAITLIVIAWLYIREIRLQLLMAQRDIWRDIADRRREETPGSGPDAAP